MLLSINQISELTGQDRRAITKQLDGLPFQSGDKNAYLYESAEALPRVYAMDNLEAARAAQARSRRHSTPCARKIYGSSAYRSRSSST